MQTMRKMFVSFSLVAVLLGLNGANNIFADPIKNPHLYPITFPDCGGETITVVVPPGGSPVGLILDRTGAFIATEATIIDTETGEEFGPNPLGAGHGRAQGLQDALVTCTSEPVELEEGFELVFRVTGFFVPR